MCHKKSNTLNRVIMRLIMCVLGLGRTFRVLLFLCAFFTPVIICFLSFIVFNATDGLPGRPLGEGPTPADWRKG